jgi:hypothetical protein
MELNTSTEDLQAADTVDMVLVLSSDLVCQIAEKYFNSTMLKKKVKVIDLKATSNGLVQFNVAFEAVPLPVQKIHHLAEPVSNTELTQQRASNGRFKKGNSHG